MIIDRLTCVAGLGAVMLGLGGCKSDEPGKRSDTQAERTIVVYAVASNNLESALAADRREMEYAASDIEGLGSTVRVLLYQTTLSDTPCLYELDASSGTFVEVRRYDNTRFSTDPVRMKEVFADVRTLRPADNYGVIFWSHGTGWVPDFSDHVQTYSKRSFGQDKYNGVSDSCDIDQLATAIPDGMFDFVWFDCCYMSGIETLYQLRGKCETIVAYPTEVWGEGMPYHLTLPAIAQPVPDLTGAANILYDYFASSDRAVTVTVIDPHGLEDVAETAAAIYAAGSRPSGAGGLLKYSRSSYYFYDFVQYTLEYASSSPDAEKLCSEFKSAFDRMVILSLGTPFDFNHSYWNKDNLSGISCHFLGSRDVASETYYLDILDWGRRVYPH